MGCGGWRKGCLRREELRIPSLAGFHINTRVPLKKHVGVSPTSLLVNMKPETLEMDEVVLELHTVQMVEGIEMVEIWLVSHSHQIHLLNYLAVYLTFYTCKTQKLSW